jgi:SAM-dependent methyltransferase
MSTVSYRDFTGTAAENYQRYFVPAIATPVSAGLLETARLQPGERVLDVACGTGVIARLAAEAAGLTGSVTGIDLAPDMIDVARATRAPAEPPIGWHIGDAASLPFPTTPTTACFARWASCSSPTGRLPSPRCGARSSPAAGW